MLVCIQRWIGRMRKDRNNINHLQIDIETPTEIPQSNVTILEGHTSEVNNREPYKHLPSFNFFLFFFLGVYMCVESYRLYPRFWVPKQMQTNNLNIF